MNDLMNRYISDLKLKSYAKRSIQSYLRAMRQLQNFCSKALEDITEEDLREYWLFCKDDLQWGNATLRISYSAVKLFFTLTLKRDWEVLSAVKFERDQTLPVVLNIDEVRRIISAFPRGQNHAFFSLVYGCGLRLSEAITLHVADVDGKRKCLHVHRAKGAKDRWVPIPEPVLNTLRDYWKTHRNNTWLFPALGKTGREGPTAERPVSHTTVQGALRRTLVRLKIRKRVTAHTFRHLIEANVAVRHVQEYLGHASLATVMIYLHVTSHGREDSIKRMNQLMRGVLS
jgi:integrase/recombinase XerD